MSGKDCKHLLVHAWTDPDGVPVAWSCDFCQLRFYPACRECVDVGHRNVVHPKQGDSHAD